MISNQTLFQEFGDEGFEEMETAFWIFTTEGTSVICYIDNLILLAGKAMSIDVLKTELVRKLKSEDLKNWYQFLRNSLD